MDAPTLDNPPDRLHLLLAERGSAILPEAGNADGRVSLTDAMLIVAALAPCLALFRGSLVLGLASLAVVLPALARTHVAMVRARGVGSPSGVGAWLVALASSTVRIVLILGLVAVIYAASLVLGSWLGGRFAYLYLANAEGFGSAGARQWVYQTYSWYGCIAGFVVLAIPLTLLALSYLIPRLLTVREPI